MLLRVFTHPLISVNFLKASQCFHISKPFSNKNTCLSLVSCYAFSSTSQSLQVQQQTSQSSPPSQSLQVQQQPSQLYTQRAFTPSQITSQMISQLPKTPYPTIIHQLSLYSSKLLPFDYDYFVESLKWLSPHQNHLSLAQLMMLFDLAIEYKIDNLLIQTHFQNQLYCRVYLMTKKELAQYDIDVRDQLDKTYQALEASSKDHFNVIADKFKQLLAQDDRQNEPGQEDNSSKNQRQQEDVENENDNDKDFPTTKAQQSSSPLKITNKPTYNASERKIKSRTLQQQLLHRISHIFLSSNSRHIQFNKLLLQINTIRLDQYTHSQSSLQTPKQHPQLTPQFLLTYTRLAINLLQLYMTQYQSALDASTKTQPAKYTRRSVKSVYKVQAFYYYEVAKLVEEKRLLESATDAELVQFVQLMAGFPIKRRSFRKAIGEVLIEQTKRRQLPYDGLIKFFELSRFDNKLLEHFQNTINGIVKLPTQQPPSVEQTSQEKQVQQPTNQLADPLVPEILSDSDHPLNQLENDKLFKMPASLFRKITKKKSKPKNKQFMANQSEEIDLTHSDEVPLTQKLQNQSAHNHSSTAANRQSTTIDTSLKQKQDIAK